MVEIINYSDALELSAPYGNKCHLLLGNGFSIACQANIFRYGALLDNADFSTLSHKAPTVFEALNTSDFEIVIRHLLTSSKILPVYNPDLSDLAKTIIQDAERLKDILVKTIAGHHPGVPFEISDSQYYACRKFLAPFNHIYTLNYDLLLYWTLMHNEPDNVDPIKLSTNDGFAKPDDDYDAPYVIWDGEGGGHGQNVHYLHGALHLFDAGSELQKYTWSNTGIPLIEQIRDAMNKALFPLFVAEGTSDSKLKKIKHSAYLHKAFRSFSSIQGCLFIFGHSLASNDRHILQRIEKEKLVHLFTSIFGNPNSEENRQIIANAERIQSNRAATKPLKLTFYDAETAQVWG